ncbi:hypothetical protein K3495_g10290 [Podosphaera aphanis]|nr:hypothetical protein K3495_g10290 [Podosphaera aphanis]
MRQPTILPYNPYSCSLLVISNPVTNLLRVLALSTTEEAPVDGTLLTNARR